MTSIEPLNCPPNRQESSQSLCKATLSSWPPIRTPYRGPATQPAAPVQPLVLHQNAFGGRFLARPPSGKYVRH